MSENEESVAVADTASRDIDVLATEFLLSLKNPPKSRVAAWAHLAGGGFVSSQKDGLFGPTGAMGYGKCDPNVVFSLYERESATDLPRGCHDEIAVRDAALVNYSKLPAKSGFQSRYLRNTDPLMRAENNRSDLDAIGAMPTRRRMHGVSWGPFKDVVDFLFGEDMRWIIETKDVKPGAKLSSEGVERLSGMNTRDFYDKSNRRHLGGKYRDVIDMTSFETEMVDGKPKEFGVLNVPFDIGEAYRPKAFMDSPGKYVDNVIKYGGPAREAMMDRKASKAVEAVVDSQGIVRGAHGVGRGGGLRRTGVSGRAVAADASRAGRVGVAARPGAGVAGLPAVWKQPQRGGYSM